jgi:hypothetical protein
MSVMALFAHLSRERRLRLLPGNSKGHSRGVRKTDVRKVDDQQQYKKERTRC